MRVVLIQTQNCSTAHSDRAAGLIELIINSFGKMHDDAARWIANRLQPAPFMALCRKNAAGELIWAWVSAEEAGVPYDEKTSTEANYKYWSEKFPAACAARITGGAAEIHAGHERPQSGGHFEGNDISCC